MKEKPKAILFDIDDTLFCRNKAQHEVAKLLCNNYPDIFSRFDPHKVEDAFVQSDKLIDLKFPQIDDIKIYRLQRSKIFMELLGITEDFSELLTKAYIDLYPTVNAAVDNIDKVFSHIYRKFRLGVISNGYEDVQYSKLKALGIIDYFDYIVICGEGENSKPNKKVFLRVCNLMKLTPHDCLYIGDSLEKDVIGSKNAGMLSCWYNPDKKSCQSEVKPDYIINTFAGLIEIL